MTTRAGRARAVDFKSALARLPADTTRDYEGHLDDVPGIFALMTPMPCAVKSFCELAGLFDTYVLSTSPWENPSAWSDKLLWVTRHLGKAAHKRPIMTHHKNLNVGDFLVDDRGLPRQLLPRCKSPGRGCFPQHGGVLGASAAP